MEGDFWQLDGGSEFGKLKCSKLGKRWVVGGCSVCRGGEIV